MRSIANRVTAARGCWWPHLSRGNFFYLLYIFINSIGTCMQNFIKIAHRKNQTFFFQNNWSMFLRQTVLQIRKYVSSVKGNKVKVNCQYNVIYHYGRSGTISRDTETLHFRRLPDFSVISLMMILGRSSVIQKPSPR